MSDIYQIANVGLIEGKQRLEAISMNAASASLTGYRRHIVTGRTFDAALAASNAAVPAGSPDASSLTQAAVQMPQRVDLRRGASIVTGRALDVAIEADDLFFALTDGVQTWLTRAGSLRVNEAGVLIGERGLRVVGAQGDMRLPATDVEMSADGRISYQGVVVAALQLYRANDRAALHAGEGSLLVSPAGFSAAEQGAIRLRSGALEASNTDASREMLGLMTLSRQFESLSHVVQSYDELLGRTIQKLAEI